jgi:hypothetical protein
MKGRYAALLHQSGQIVLQAAETIGLVMLKRRRFAVEIILVCVR